MSASAINSAELTIPGKAFLAGEYLALLGGPALVAAVEPRFVLRASPLSPTQKPHDSSFHEKSPAGILLAKNLEILQEYRLQFYDPHQGRGGWGGSTAEFALLHCFLNFQKSGFAEVGDLIDLRRVWSEYRDVSALEGQRPSGADLIAQMQGGLTLFDRGNGKIDQFVWNFKNLGFLLFRTKNKLPTHRHLESLGHFSGLHLTRAMERVLSGLQLSNESDFVAGINEYATELDQLGFLADQSKELLKNIRHPGVLAKKGCGAMGADVLCLFYEKVGPAKFEIIDEVSELELDFVASDEALCEGFQSSLNLPTAAATARPEVNL